MSSAVTALVVEDNPSMRELLVHALRRIPGIATMEACDGLDALNKIDGRAPDIILTDINMPVMDGWTLLKHVRARDRNVPVVIITTEKNPRERARAMALGATSYMTKPLKAPDLLGEVRALLGRTPQ